MKFSIKYLISEHKKELLIRLIRSYFWFVSGAVLGLFFFISFTYIIYRNTYRDVVFPGIYIDNIDFSGKTKDEVSQYFNKKNQQIQKTIFHLKHDELIATISAKDLDFGYNEELLANQAFSIGRASNAIANFSLIAQSYLYGVHLPGSYKYDEDYLIKQVSAISEKIYKTPIDARFTFQDGKVLEFQTSSDGQELDSTELKKRVSAKTLTVVKSTKPLAIYIAIPVKILHPETTTDEANNFGIKELVAVGSSQFVGSIPNRMYNIALAATRLNGILIKPDEIFSFNKALGDVSTFTGYKQAYIIQNGRTVLGDGGGVCQVSTTFFRAVLNAGLPIVERNPHAYRVSYYEQDSGPGFDAAIFVPSVDFKFKNDTKHHLLIKTDVNPDSGYLTFELYGTKDDRQVTISKPVITSVTSSPEPLYIDDPTLPKGEVKQVDFAVSGANVYFTRVVRKDGEVISDDTFNSRYRPWQAVYMRGTKE